LTWTNFMWMDANINKINTCHVVTLIWVCIIIWGWIIGHRILRTNIQINQPYLQFLLLVYHSEFPLPSHVAFVLLNFSWKEKSLKLVKLSLLIHVLQVGLMKQLDFDHAYTYKQKKKHAEDKIRWGIELEN